MVLAVQQNVTTCAPILETKYEFADFEDVDKNKESSKTTSNNLRIKVFKRRWLQLMLFVLYSASNNFQWFQYTIISNIMRRFYNVSSLAIDWTSMIIMVMYIVLLIPASYLMDRYGLRKTILFSGFLTCLGAWIKVFSTSPDRYLITFIGQCLIAVSQVCVFTTPGRLATQWFGLDQIASATAIAYSGIQLGFIVCFALTTMFIKNHELIEDIGNDLSAYFLVTAIFCTINMVPLIFLFQEEPRLPPTQSRALQKLNRENTTDNFWPVIKRILKNRSLLLLWNSYGLMLSILTTINTVMNSFYLAHFKNAEADVGGLGLVAVIFGVIGSGGFAFILDKTKKFRTIIISISSFALLSQILLAVSLIIEIRWMVFVAAAMIGIFLSGYITLGLELCAEVTYPEPEGITMAIFNTSSQVYGIILILITGRLIDIYGDIAGHVCFSVVILTGNVLTVLNKFELRRDKAAQIANYRIVPLQTLQQNKILPE